MSTAKNEIVVADPSGEIQHELAHLQKNWIWLALLGVLLVICGAVAIAFPFASSVSVVAVLGAMLLVGGIALIVSSFWTGTWSGFLVQLLIGITYTVVGLMIADSPLQATGALTLLVAAMFVVVGIFRMVAAISLQFPQWGWVLLNGAITLLFGIIVFQRFPESVLWLIGILFGVDLIFNGFSWLMLAVDVRNTKVTAEKE